MPKGFEDCRRRGGKIRTIKPRPDVYIPVCYIGGKSYRGEVHHVKKGSTAQTIKKGKRMSVADAISQRMGKG